MTNGDGKRRAQLWRTVAAVAVISALIVAALFSAIGSLNRDVYSAGGFVRQYLDALARHAPVSALALDGVRPSDEQLTAAGLPLDLPSTLLRSSVLPEFSDIRLLDDVETEPGVHTVNYEFRLNGEKSSMAFSVERAGTYAGVFNSWRFRTSPLAVLRVTVLHEAKFAVSGLPLDTRVQAAPDAPPAFSNQAAYLAFAPATYSLTHESAFLTAEPVEVAVTETGITDVALDAQPNETFIGQVQTELNRFLDECATQQVLKPSSCPFGIDIDDRVRGLPTWSIAEYPPVTLTAGESGFVMPDTTGQAHIEVDVRSLFDGDVSTRSENVPFAVGLTVSIKPDGSLAIQLH